MINFWQVAAHFLWILGLAVLLATWSMGYYEAQAANQPLATLLKKRGYNLAMTAGLALVCAGAAATDDRWWARLVWAGLGVAAVVWFARRGGKEEIGD